MEAIRAPYNNMTSFLMLLIYDQILTYLVMSRPLHAEMEAIRARLGAGGDENNTPLGDPLIIAIAYILTPPIITYSPSHFFYHMYSTTVPSDAPVGMTESLRQFYSRTAAHWSSEVIQRWREAQGQGQGSGLGQGQGLDQGAGQVMGEKEIKREGFVLAEVRYNTPCHVNDRTPFNKP